MAHNHSHHKNTKSTTNKWLKRGFYLFVGLVTGLLLLQENINFSAEVSQGKDQYYVGEVTKVDDKGVTVAGVRSYMVEVVVETEKFPDPLVVPYEEIDGQKHIDIEVGDKLILSQFYYADPGELFIIDEYRIPQVLYIFVFFFIVTTVIAGVKGLSSLLGLAFSLLVLVKFVVVQITLGHDPLLVSFLGALLIASVSIYLAHGISKQTTVALVGTLATIVLTILFASVFVEVTDLLGIGSEEAVYVGSYIGSVNLKGLLLGGIILGTLGVLDDVTTAQTAAVAELSAMDKSLDTKTLFRKASNIGREHIVSLVNTLVLAYVGTSFPIFLLLISTSAKPLWVTLSSPFFVEEVVRSVTGSLALILAVPITTFIAAYYFTHGYFFKTDSLLKLIKRTHKK